MTTSAPDEGREAFPGLVVDRRLPASSAGVLMAELDPPCAAHDGTRTSLLALAAAKTAIAAPLTGLSRDGRTSVDSHPAHWKKSIIA